MNEKKKYVIPEAEVLAFGNDDIITLSEAGDLAGYLEEGDKEGW
jgi:hypothetical protein